MLVFWQDIRHASRTFLHQPATAGVAAAVIALGIAANATVFSAVRAVLLAPLPYSAPHRLVVLREHNRAKGLADQRLPPARYRAWSEQTDVFSGVAAFDLAERNLTGLGTPLRADVARISSALLTVAGIQPLEGRAFGAWDERHDADAVAILSHDLWQRVLHGESIAGRTLHLDDEIFAIVGVLPPGFALPAADVYVPLVIAFEQSRVARHLQVVGRLADGVDVAGAQAHVDALAAVLQTSHPATDEGWTASVVPLTDVVAGDIAPALRLLLGAAGLVLLIASASVANLLLVRAVRRRREFAVRVAVGATRGRLLRQILTESALIAAAGGVAGLLIAAALMPAIRALGFARFETIRIDAAVAGFTLAATALAAALAGAAPALAVAHADAAPTLAAGSARVGGGPRRWSGVIIAFQIALAVALSSTATLLTASLVNAMRVDPGFRADGVITAHVSFPRPRYPGADGRRRFANALVERAAALPGVVAAGVVSHIPLGGRSAPFNVHVDGRAAPTHAGLLSAEMRAASPGYFQTMGIPVIAGRSIEERDTSSATPVVVVNRTMAARFWPGADAVGRRISLEGPDGPWITVVGITGDVRQDVAQAARPEMYLPYAQEAWPRLVLAARTEGDAALLALPIREAVAALDPELAVYDVRLMEDLKADAVARPRLQGVLAAAFAGLALLLAVAGVYGVMAHAATARAPEMAVRLALGGNRGSITRLMVGHGALIVAAGVASGIAGAWAARPVVAGLLFGIAPGDPRVLAGSAAIVAAAALAACYIPARRVSRVDPASVLRAT